MIKYPVLLIFLLHLTVWTDAQNKSAAIKENYTKKEVYITMRDGVRLFTTIYAPKDHTKTYPIMILRTPYSLKPYGEDEYTNYLLPSRLFVNEGYIFVSQDVRGRWMSEGTFVDIRPYNPNKKNKNEIDESSDTYDTVDWLIKN